MRKIYLDDVRTPVDKEWIVVRSYDEFVEKINEIGLENIELISLDHDLGDTAVINVECEPIGGDKIIEIIPTKNGYHLITEKFNVKTFKKRFPEMDIQKKNPTLLYYPESLV